MHRFKSVVFSPLGRDDNRAALRQVSDLVQRDQASLTLFEATPVPPKRLRLTRTYAQIEQLATAHRELHQHRLDDLASMVDTDHVDVAIDEGSPAVALIRRVLAVGHDLVVVTTDDDREDRATINRLLRKCPCPVWVIRRTRARKVRVLAAINPDPDEAELNRSILEIAATRADSLDGELHVAHAYELFAEHLLRSPVHGGYSEPEVDLLRHKEAAARRHELVRLAESSLGHRPQLKLHVVDGHPAAAIIDLVTHLRISLLVLGTVARSGLSGVLIGNTAETILADLANTDCSVLAVKPPEFVSPITAH